MKTKYMNSLFALLIVLGGCSEVIIYEPTKEEIDKYSRVYMPRAEGSAVNIAMSNKEEEVTFEYNAYLGGPVDADKDISVTFAADPSKVAVYNEANETTYDILPTSSYELSATTAVIKSGSRSTPILQLKIKSGSHLALFKTYVLPLSIISADATVNEKLTTAYYVVNIGYPPGEVPTELVLNLGNNWGSFIGPFPGKGLLKLGLGTDGKIYAWEYALNSEGKYGPAQRLGSTEYPATKHVYYVNETTMIFRNQDDHSWVGAVDRNHPNILIDQPPGFPHHHIGDDWRNNMVMIPYGNYMLTITTDGKMRRQNNLTRSGWTWGDNTREVGVRTEVGTGFNAYKQVLSFQNNSSLLAVDAFGDLWYYSMSEEAIPGVRKLVGKGWQMYHQLMVSGGDILALKSNGEIFRYAEFNPKGFYPLNKE